MYPQNSSNSFIFYLVLIIIILAFVIGLSLSSTENLYAARIQADQQIQATQIALHTEYQIKLQQAKTEQEMIVLKQEMEINRRLSEQLQSTLDIGFMVLIGSAIFSFLSLLIITFVRVARNRALSLAMTTINRENLNRPIHRPSTAALEARKRELEKRALALQKEVKSQEELAIQLSRDIREYLS